MTAAPAPTTRDLQAAAALRGMVIGAVGLLCGGAIVLCAAYGFGAPIASASGLQQRVGIVLAGGIAALGALSFVRALVVHEELHRGSNAVSIVLVTLVTVPLGGLGLGGYLHTHPPDKQVTAGAVPYTFDYPGTWERNRPMEGMATQGNIGYVTAFGDRAGGDPGQGVLVVVFAPENRSELAAWVRATRDGVRVANERTIRIAGRPALAVDYERAPGKPFQSQAAVMRGGVAYVVTCFLELEPAEARKGCQQVLDTFRFT